MALLGQWVVLDAWRSGYGYECALDVSRWGRDP